MATNTRQVQTAQVPGEQIITGPGVTGLPRLTGALVHGQHGGTAAHVRPQTGRAGLLDHGVRMRRGLLGQVVQLARHQRVWELLL